MKIVKKVVAWPTSWLLFWFGNFCSKGATKIAKNHEGQTEIQDIRFSFLFDWYQRLMTASLMVQDWADLSNGPWHPAEEDNQEL